MIEILKRVWRAVRDVITEVAYRKPQDALVYFASLTAIVTLIIGTVLMKCNYNVAVVYIALICCAFIATMVAILRSVWLEVLATTTDSVRQAGIKFTVFFLLFFLVAVLCALANRLPWLQCVFMAVFVAGVTCYHYR